jgi:hypothetical protein
LTGEKRNEIEVVLNDMIQDINIYFQKLSDPLVKLDISPRACRALRRAGITTVADVVLAGRQKLDSIRQVGSITVDEVWGAVVGHLELSDEQLADTSSQRNGTYAAVRKSSTMTLSVRASTLQALSSMSIYFFDGLIRSRSIGYSNLHGMEAEQIAEIDQALRFQMTRFAIARLLQRIEYQDKPDPFVMEGPSCNDLGLILQQSGNNNDVWSILELASMHRYSLKAIGTLADGIGREGVRQMIEQAQEMLHHKLGELSLFLDHFEKRSKIFRKWPEDGPLDLKTLVPHLLPDLTKSNLIIERREVIKMILLIRCLVLFKKDWFWEEMEPRWRTFIRLSCLVAPDLTKEEQIWLKSRATNTMLIPSTLFCNSQ